MGTETRTARLLGALARVQSAGRRLDPMWDSHLRYGFTYRSGGSTLDDAAFADALEELADQDYVERIFIERLTICPSCNGHALNVHEACLSCGSSNLVQFRALFHFRCGFVGPASAFRPEPNGRRCPKCSKILVDLGTDHDSPGDFFRCRNCASKFQDPEIGARCLSCSARFTGAELQSARHRDVFAYRITPLGNAALEKGRLLDDPAETFASSGGLRSRHAIVERIESERRVRAASGEPFAVLVVQLSGPLDAPTLALLRNEMPMQLEVGRLDARNLVALLAGLPENRARALCVRLNERGRDTLCADVLAIDDGDEIDDALDFAVGSLEAYSARG